MQLLNLQKEDKFLDVCAAPGGKFTQVLETVPGINLAVAVDSDISRLKKVKQNLKRLELSGFLVAADARFLPFKIKFSRILIDAPCSGQGVIGKHPEIKWRRKEQEVAGFAQLQKEILASVTQLLAESGQIVYSTCSIDKAENENVVDDVLAKSGSSLEKLSLPNDPFLKEIKKMRSSGPFPTFTKWMAALLFC